MPWQLEHVLGATCQLHDIEQVQRTGNDGARDLAVAATNPGPVPCHVERLAHRVARGLGRAVQSWRIVRQGRAVPKEIGRDVGSRSRVGQPVHAIRVEGEMQPVGVPVPAAVRAALEARIAAFGAQHGEPLGLE